ncbi:MAG: hypothetical protein AB7F88_15120 [Pyrinomonadaceae bacterium]
MQPTLFDSPNAAVSIDDAILYALGEFQSRGHLLADRELALDRLRHAFDRACDKLGIETLPDETVASLLKKAGAAVVEIPDYFAKRPFRVTVPPALALDALTVYHQINDKLS